MSQVQPSDASIHCIERCFHGKQGRAAIKLRCAVWLARVTTHGIVEIYAAFRHMRGNAASGFPGAWVCLYLTLDECSLTDWGRSRAVGDLENKNKNKTRTCKSHGKEPSLCIFAIVVL
jgi:hypothetical protein